MNRLKSWWIAVQDFFGFYVPDEVSADMPRSLAEHRARKEALLAKLRRAERMGA
jgi:hypothetical protein